MSEVAMDRPIYWTFGPLSEWEVELLTDAGFQARMVMGHGA